MGHPRSGTVYMSKLCQAFGLDVGDERHMGEDGISSFLIGASENPRWGPDPWKYDFENRLHLVRNPLSVVSSVLACVTEGVQEYMARESGIDAELPAPKRVLMVYKAWHDRIMLRKPNMRVKVEEAPGHFEAWLGRAPDSDMLPPTDVNNRSSQLGGLENPPDFSLKYFQDNVPLGIFYAFTDLISEYGYEL